MAVPFIYTNGKNKNDNLDRTLKKSYSLIQVTHFDERYGLHVCENMEEHHIPRGAKLLDKISSWYCTKQYFYILWRNYLLIVELYV